MSKREYSAELMRQTALAWEFLDMAKSITTYMKLVPVMTEQIDEYEKAYDKIVPPDYRYWLETHGSGHIEFITDALEIPSIYELCDDGGRLVDNDDPANCWKRIYLGCGGAPVTLALDSTIIDEFGCAPVIRTEVYSNQVGEVLSSSWPMYVVLKIIEAAKEVATEDPDEADGLAKVNFEGIDAHLLFASERAIEHNKTRLADGETPSDMEEIISISKFIESMTIATETALDTHPAQLQSGAFQNDQYQQAVDTLEKEISLGYAYLGLSGNSFAARQFLTEEVTARHERALKDLLKHQRREMRDFAREGLQKINTIAPQEDNKKSEDLFKCIKIAMELNEEYEQVLKAKKLHFRGNIGSFSLISLDRNTPEQGKGGFSDKEHGRRFLNEKIDSLLASKGEKIKANKSRPTREKELQAWIIDYAINHEYRLPFSEGLTFLTSELAFRESEKIVNDILAIDQEGSLVVIELKSSRNKTTLEGQVENFCRVIGSKQGFFKELVALLVPKKVWNGQIRKMIVWPNANGVSRNDWKGNIEEIRYHEKLGEDRRTQIDYNEKGEIVFLEGSPQ